MKKIFTLALLAAASASMAAGDFNYLKKITTETELEYADYTYNTFNKVASELHMDMLEPEYSSLRKFTYDECGLCIEEAVYQDYHVTGDTDQFVLVNKCVYTYDAAGRLTRRTNYNVDSTVKPGHPEDCPLIAQANMDFTYDADGKLISVKTAFTDGLDISRDDYIYDSAGLLAKKESYSIFFGANDHTASTYYTYDEAGQLISIASYTVDFWDGYETRTNVTEYKYDASGTLTSKEVWNGGHNEIINSDVYIYSDDLRFVDTVYPVNFEDTFWHGEVSNYELMNKPVLERERYVLSDTTGQLEWYDTYFYTYTSDPSAVFGIPSAATYGNVSLKSFGAGRLALGGVDATTLVRVADMEGKTVFNGAYGNGIDLTTLPAGVYCVVANGSAFKVKK